MSVTSRLAVVGATVALAIALSANDGNYDPTGLAFVAVAIALTACAALDLRIGSVERNGNRLLPWVVAIGVLLEAALFLTLPVLLTSPPGWLVGVMAVGVAIIGLCAMRATLGRAVPFRLLLGVVVLAFVAMGLVALVMHDDLMVDVRMFQNGAARALLLGADPYTVRYRNIYADTRFYGEGLVTADGWLVLGFPYLPLVALLDVPGWLLGDVRISHVLSVGGAAIAIGLAGARREAVGAAALLLLMPRNVYLLVGGWTEPMSILMLGLVVWCAVRARRAAGIAIGLFLASKQYLILIAPLLWLLERQPRDRLRLLVGALTTGLVVTLPFAIRNPSAFLQSVVLYQLRQPFRSDSLSLLAALDHVMGTPPRVLGFTGLALAIASAVLLARRAPRTPSAFAASVALVTLLLFAFSPQAFCNYYALSHAALCAALATSSAVRHDVVGPTEVAARAR